MSKAIKKVDGAVTIAHRAVETKFEDFIKEEVLAAKKAIIDIIGVSLAGSTLGVKCHELVNLAKEMGGTEESSIIGYGGKVPAMMAAFANGAVNHALDYDICFDYCGTHPLVCCFPPALALMEKTGNLKGKELIAAMIIGSDIVYRTGAAASSEAQKEYGIFAAYANAYVGSAVAAGRIMGFDKEQMVGCLGLGYSQTCGSMQVLYETDSNLREIFPAFGSKSAVMAALLTEKGVKGLKESLEGKGGYFNAFVRGDYDPALINVKPGDPFLITEMTIKPYSSCRQTHMFIDASKEIFEKHNLTMHDVAKVTLKVGKFGKTLCVPEDERRKPPLPMDARFSIPYCVAAYMVDGNVGVEQFTMEKLNDPKILAAAQLIGFEMGDSIDIKSLVEAGGVIIECKDGRKLEAFVEDSYGSPKNPMGMDGVIAKFKNNAKHSRKPLSEADMDRVVEICMDLENVEDITELIQLIS